MPGSTSVQLRSFKWPTSVGPMPSANLCLDIAHLLVPAELTTERLAVVAQLRAAAGPMREFLTRAVRYAAGLGVEQFLGIGWGLPGPLPTDRVASAASATAWAALTDVDPMVTAHARANRFGEAGFRVRVAEGTGEALPNGGIVAARQTADAITRAAA